VVVFLPRDGGKNNFRYTPNGVGEYFFNMLLRIMQPMSVRGLGRAINTKVYKKIKTIVREDAMRRDVYSTADHVWGAAEPEFLPICVENAGFLYDSRLSIELIRNHRWKSGYFCPVCSSHAVKRINSFVVHELFQCSGCGYSFNCTSRTVFQGSKLPLHKHFQLLLGFDLFAEALVSSEPPLRDIASLTGTSLRTVKLQFEKARDQGLDGDYLAGQQTPVLGEPGCSSMPLLLEHFEVLLDRGRFARRLDQWLRL